MKARICYVIPNVFSFIFLIIIYWLLLSLKRTLDKPVGVSTSVGPEVISTYPPKYAHMVWQFVLTSSLWATPPVFYRFYLLHSVHTGSGFHRASDPLDTRCSFARLKRVRCEADHSLPSGAEKNNDRAITPLPIKKTPWSESGSELYRPSDRRLSGKWLPRGHRDGSLRLYSRFSRQEPLLFYQVASQLYSRGWVDPVPDPLLFIPW
jgi:hypothetical protein